MKLILLLIKNLFPYLYRFLSKKDFYNNLIIDQALKYFSSKQDLAILKNTLELFLIKIHIIYKQNGICSYNSTLCASNFITSQEYICVQEYFNRECPFRVLTTYEGYYFPKGDWIFRQNYIRLVLTKVNKKLGVQENKYDLQIYKTILTMIQIYYTYNKCKELNIDELVGKTVVEFRSITIRDYNIFLAYSKYSRQTPNSNFKSNKLEWVTTELEKTNKKLDYYE